MDVKEREAVVGIIIIRLRLSRSSARVEAENCWKIYY